MSTHRMSKEEHERIRRDEEAQKIRAMDCLGCPYRKCIGSTAMVSRDEQTRRFREAEDD